MLKAIVLFIVLTAVIHSSFGQDNTKKLSYSKTCRCNIKYSQCINYLYVWAFTSDLLNSQSNTNHNISLRAKGLESTQTLPDLAKGNFEQGVGDLWKLSIKKFFNFDTCITLSDIESISIVAASDDGWNIASIFTYAVVDAECWQLISADYDVNQWVDGDGNDEHEEFVLSLRTIAGSCIKYLFVSAYTSDVNNAQTKDDVSHEIELKADGLAKTATLSNITGQLRGRLWKLSLVDDFGFTGCIRSKHIQGIAIVADNNDGWNIDSIVTHVAANEHSRKLSSVDLDVDRWVDLNSAAERKRFDLNLVI